jgi:uncharacterized protein RhaS with RHS repeats
LAHLRGRDHDARSSADRFRRRAHRSIGAAHPPRAPGFVAHRRDDPSTGQFLSRDPIEDTTLQPYAYAGNAPTNASDPTGLWPWSTISNAAAGTLDGLSTRLAAAYFHFDADCADFGAGFGTGQMVGTVGGFFTGGGEAAAAARGVKAGGRLAAKAESGAARSYIDITKGGSIRNVGTDATHTEFGESLMKGGWAAKTSQDGQVQMFQKDGAKYVLRERAGSHGGWTADFTPSGASDVALKIRLGYRP